MDDCMAAMVLMSLSCSPKSATLPPEGICHSWAGGSETSTSTTGWDSPMSSAGRTSTPSPPTPTPIPAMTALRHRLSPKQKTVQHLNRKSNNTVQQRERDVIINDSSTPETIIDRMSPFSSVDEGIEMDETVGFGLEDDLIKRKVRIIFQCTWPGCKTQCTTCHQIEQHVRTKHLGRTDLKTVDHEEEFYYTEIEIYDNSSTISSGASIDSPSSPADSQDGSQSESQSPVSSPQAFFLSSSAPVWNHLEDHEYFKYPCPPSTPTSVVRDDCRAPNEIKIKFIQNINSNEFLQNNDNKRRTLLTTHPINIPGLGGSCNTCVGCLEPYTSRNKISAHSHQIAVRSHAGARRSMGSDTPVPMSTSAPVSSQSSRANHKYMRLNGNNKIPVNSNGGTTLLQAPIVKMSPTKRVRGESRKCRKVYGMDNRDSWCTQCKWKKACSRFTD